MPVGTVRIRGLKECQRAFRRMSGGLDKELRIALRAAAWPVAREARQLLAEKYPGASVMTIGPTVRIAGAAVTQRKRTVTGQHPELGALEMVNVMIPALEHHEGEIDAAAEHVIDVIERMGGF